MTEEMAVDVGPSKIDMAYERLGDPSMPPVLLLMGAGGQLVDWPDGFCAELVDRGLHLIRFDSRDSGRSTRFDKGPAPDIRAAMAGDLSSAAYTLSDMAADTAGLLDALGIDSAHLIGASQGGMVAQTIAIEHPARVRSLTSMMSTTGNPNVGQPHPDGFSTEGPPPTDRAAYIDWSVRTKRAFRSGSGFAFDEPATAALAGRVFDRGWDINGFLRQATAVLASGDRTPHLRELDIPTLVIHGAADRGIDISGGRATAEAIPNATLVLLEGMGHFLPKELWPTLTTHISALIHRTEQARDAITPS
ncbi:alpha/beta fold hydrolase [Nocardia sp. NPDC052566]|uniref:alpha/beta fold hydrolase n=1 Tax=Nocardia sp. NPDC052566 TaxID=3364330 RepID=UPI0037C77558